MSTDQNPNRSPSPVGQWALHIEGVLPVIFYYDSDRAITILNFKHYDEVKHIIEAAYEIIQ